MLLKMRVVYEDQEMVFDMSVGDGRMTIKWLGEITSYLCRCVFFSRGANCVCALCADFVVYVNRRTYTLRDSSTWYDVGRTNVVCRHLVVDVYGAL